MPFDGILKMCIKWNCKEFLCYLRCKYGTKRLQECDLNFRCSNWITLKRMRETPNIFKSYLLNNLKHAVLLKDCLLRKLITWNSFHYEMNFHRNIRILKCLKYILQLYLCFICKWMYYKCVNVRSCCPTKK